MLLGRAQRARVNRRTNRMCELDPNVPFSHYSPQPYSVLVENLDNEVFRGDNALDHIFHDFRDDDRGEGNL